MRQRITSKLKLPLAVLVILLQRAPNLPSTLLARLTIPSIQIVQKAILTAISLVAPHALSGATTSKYSVDDSSYTVGTKSILHIETGKVGEKIKISISNTVTATSWTVEGTMPAGLAVTDAFNETQLVNGIINTPFPIILGTPSATGQHALILKPWSLKDGKGTTAPQQLDLVFDIVAGDPIPLVPPTLRYQPGPDKITLYWITTEAGAYQLKRSTDLTTWGPVDHPTTQNNEESSIQLPLSQTEFYRFEPTP